MRSPSLRLEAHSFQGSALQIASLWYELFCQPRAPFNGDRALWSPSVWEKVTLSEGLRTIGFPERPEMGLHQSVWGKSYFKRRSPGNEFPERPEAGLHKSVSENVALSEGLRTIGYPERPEVGLHQSVWGKVTLSEGLRTMNFQSSQRRVYTRASREKSL